MRRTLLLPLVLVVAPLAAQPPAHGMGAMNHDPTHRITGSGQLPTGWAMRFDPGMGGMAQSARATDVDVQAENGGLHVRSGPAGIYYRSSEPASGQYTLSATFSQTKSMAHEAYGLVLGGAHLQDASERYVYFIVRPMDGGILVSRRTSDARPTALVPWTNEPAVNKEDASDGHATNRLAVRVGRDSVAFFVNDKVVRTLAKADLGAPTDGLVGVRVNHNLDLHVADFRVDRRVTK